MDEEADELQGQLVYRWNTARGNEEEHIPNEVEFEEESPVKEQQPVPAVRPFEWPFSCSQRPKLLLYRPYRKYNKQLISGSQQTVCPIFPGRSTTTYNWQ